MSVPPSLSPIRMLPAQLADQIAAGEVIERPASVLKELIENALDAGSTRITIELTRGGMESIRVTDDGHGIAGEELALAVCRHATSKISQLDDLLNLRSLGFRGEALASICSVSQWEITSHRRGDDQAFALRVSQAQQVLPASHQAGTSVWIRKLFFNTPARRKFLRTERTEFRHCDEVVRRMALARFDVAFYVKHNGRQVHRLPAVVDDIGRSRRVGQLCGEVFVRNSLVIDFPRSDMRLWGWISKPDFSRQQSDMQYFYINGRIIRDRVINHALRLAYQPVLAPGRQAAFVLHLDVDPASVDVNVHPTKHEVRFREARQVHDFLIHCLRESLLQSGSARAISADYAVNDVPAAYASPATSPLPVLNASGLERSGPGEGHAFFGVLQNVLLNRFVLTQTQDRLFLVDVQRAQVCLGIHYWKMAYASGDIKHRPILFPQQLALSRQQQHHFERAQGLLEKTGFDLTQSGPQQLLLRAIPVWLQGFNSEQMLLSLLEHEINSDFLFDRIEQSLLSVHFDIAQIDFKQFLNSLNQHRDLLAMCWREMSPDDLIAWLREPHPQHE